MSTLNASSATIGLDYQSVFMVPGNVIHKSGDQTIKDGDGSTHFTEIFFSGWRQDYFGVFSNYAPDYDSESKAEYPLNIIINSITSSYQGNLFFEWSGLTANPRQEFSSHIEINQLFLAGNDTLTGGLASDRLAGFSGNDSMDGGAGTDTAYYQANRSEYKLDKTTTGYTLTALTSNAASLDGTDQISNFEYLQFKDGTYRVADYTYNTHTYRLTSSAMTWQQAEAEAVALGGHLVTINDSAENSWLKSTVIPDVILAPLGNQNSAWIGYSDNGHEGQWTWADGSSASFTHWNTGEPNNQGAFGAENYAHLGIGWNDLSGSESLYGIIEIPPSTTPPTTQSKDAQFLVLQPSSPSIVGAGVGDDTYLLSGSMIPSGKNITISDASGANSIQLAAGLSITTTQVTSNALKMTLNNGSTVTVLGANAFTYEAGGNSSAGINAVDVSFNTFVTSTLGTSIPSTGVATGNSLVINSAAPASLLASTTTGNDFVTLQYASPSIVGAGTGNDTYLISSAMLPTGTSLTISDATGSNSIQLAPGLSITGSQVAATALKLTLNTGATVTVLGANAFTYDVGGNTTAGIDQADVSFATLVQSILGTTVPTSGTSNGGAVVIGGASGLTGIAVQGNTTVNATAANEGEVVTLTLLGLVDSSLVGVHVI